MKLIENVGIGTELGKRFYLEGVILEKECSCGNVMKVDLGSNYLCYPCVGHLERVYVYCDECDTEHNEALKVKVVVNLEVYE